MDYQLWKNIKAYEFDQDGGEYTFSLRLASEQCWTKVFTEQAIEEYRKFMYLAATADQMVSPSEIVDHVWHQHLVYTKRYQQFCEIIGK